MYAYVALKFIIVSIIFFGGGKAVVIFCQQYNIFSRLPKIYFPYCSSNLHRNIHVFALQNNPKNSRWL